MPHPLAGHYNYKTANWDDIFSRAEDGDLEAVAIGANILFQGFGHPLTNPKIRIDTLLARQWLEQGAAIEATHESGTERLCTVMHGLMQTAHIGLISKEQEDQGREKLLKNRTWIQTEAAAGNAAVLRILSFMHGRGGLGVKRNVDKAIELLKLAAEKNDPFALYDLGTIYTGAIRESDRDYLEAARYFKRAALMGHADAQREVGVIITNALANDIKITSRIAQIAIDQPNIAAQYDDLQNTKFGMELLETSAKQGRISAMYSLGRAYSGASAFNGAVERNVETAVQWYQQAVDKGYPRAFIELAKLYETWFNDTGENHQEHNKATALIIYNHLLGRPRKPGDKITVATQPLTPDQVIEVQRRRAALEEEAIKDSKTWYRYANGDRRITFDDGTMLTLTPYQDETNPKLNVPADIARAQDHETGNGHAKSLNEAYSIYKELLARTADGEYTMPTADEIKKIKLLMAAIEKRADSVIEQPNGNRTLIFKGGIGKPDDIVFAGPKDVPDYKKKKAAAKAAKGSGDAPERPTDTSQTSDKAARNDRGKKNET